MICSRCGAKLKDGAKFCQNCGIAFEEKVIQPNGANNPQIRQNMTQSFLSQRQGANAGRNPGMQYGQQVEQRGSVVQNN